LIKYILSKEFGWTEEEIKNTSVDYVRFCLKMLEREEKYIKKELSKIKNARYN